MSTTTPFTEHHMVNHILFSTFAKLIIDNKIIIDNKMLLAVLLFMVRSMHSVSLRQSSTIFPINNHKTWQVTILHILVVLIFAHARSMRCAHEEYGVASAQGDGLPSNRSGALIEGEGINGEVGLQYKLWINNTVG